MLRTRVDGRGRQIPTPAPDKTGYTEAAGGFGGPLLKTVHCIVKNSMNPQQSQSVSHMYVISTEYMYSTRTNTVYGTTAVLYLGT